MRCLPALLQVDGAQAKLKQLKQLKQVKQVKQMKQMKQRTSMEQNRAVLDPM